MHTHGPFGQAHSHVPTGDQPVTLGSMLILGISGGIIPCPSALVVLLGAISQHQVALGMVLILAFSLGLAAAMTAIGLAVVHAGRLTARIDFRGRTAAVLPVVSGLVIVGAGLLLSVRAVPQLL